MKFLIAFGPVVQGYPGVPLKTLHIGVPVATSKQIRPEKFVFVHWVFQNKLECLPLAKLAFDFRQV